MSTEAELRKLNRRVVAAMLVMAVCTLLIIVAVSHQPPPPERRTFEIRSLFVEDGLGVTLR